MTEHGRYLFHVKAFADGSPWIMFVPLDEDDNMSVTKRGFIGLDLWPGTTHERAQKLADLLTELVPTLSYTELTQDTEADYTE